MFKPEIKIEKFEMMDVISTSTEPEETLPEDENGMGWG